MNNPNFLAFLVAAIWGLAPIFEKISLKSMDPMLVLTVRFILVTCMIIPFFLVNYQMSSIATISLKNLILIIVPGILAAIGIYIYFNALIGSSFAAFNAGNIETIIVIKIEHIEMINIENGLISDGIELKK